MDWIQNPHADYVLAAYAVAAIALIGFAIASWLSARAAEKKYKSIGDQ